jgi:hypothetical protein
MLVPIVGVVCDTKLALSATKSIEISCLDYLQRNLKGIPKSMESDSSSMSSRVCMLLPAASSLAIATGMFWFAWTNGPNRHWLISVAVQVPFGFGFVLVYLSIQSYLVDAYTIHAASVLASNVLLRSGLGAAFPLFTTVYLFLGVNASLICSTCPVDWVCTGHPRFPPSSHWRACHCPSFIISMAHASAKGVGSREKRASRGRVLRIRIVLENHR